MSGTRPDSRDLDASSVRVAIIAARWQPKLVDALVARAEDAARAAQARYKPEEDLHRVDGSGELASVADAVAATTRYQAIVALGFILRGGTPHFESVIERATVGLQQVSLARHIPIGDGVVAVLDAGQAAWRVGDPELRETALARELGCWEDKGGDAMRAALGAALTIGGLTSTPDPRGFGVPSVARG